MKPITIKPLIGETLPIVKVPKHLLPSGVNQISFGTRQMNCIVETAQGNRDEIFLSEELLQSLCLPSNRQMHFYITENTLHVGPLIGIFTAGFTDSILRPIGERSLFFAKLLSTEKSIGVVSFVFGAHLINWLEGTVNGYFYDEKTGWYQKDIPLPDVIYDRLPNRKTENHSAIQKIKSRLQKEYFIPWYNPGFFNKWEIFKSLQSLPAVQKYLPKTIYNPNAKDLAEMISIYKHVYIKPANGSLGLGIYQVVLSEDGSSYYCRYRDEEENKLRKFSSVQKLIQYLFSRRKLEHYIVQQGIHLIRYESRPVDFRIHTNKDKQGQWVVSALAAKVAGKGSVTTHLNNGGMIKTIDELFPLKDKREKLTKRLHDVVIQISESISEHMDGNIGEIGFDIGLDQDGKIWLFEANSKPGRAIFTHPKLRNEDKFSRQLSLSYGIYLAEKGMLSIEEINI